MKARLLVGLMGAGLVFAPLVSAQTPTTPATREQKKRPAAKAQKSEPAMSADMREAIAFERNKDIADERQARLEAKHPSVSYTDANRSADRNADESQGKPVKDPGPTVKKDKDK
jgi:hypothetical protein